MALFEENHLVPEAAGIENGRDPLAVTGANELYGAPGQPQKALPNISQETLAEMIGTTRARVNFFMNKFRSLGFLDYSEVIHINNSLLSVVLND